MIHLIEEELDGKVRAFQIFEQERIKKPELELLKAFQRQNPGSAVNFMAPVLNGWKDQSVEIRPWEDMVIPTFS